MDFHYFSTVFPMVSTCFRPLLALKTPRLERLKDLKGMLRCQKLYARGIKLLVTPPLVAVRESLAKDRGDVKAWTPI